MTQTQYNSAGVSPRVNVYAERQMLKHAAPVVVLDKFGMSKPMPKNKSQTVKFRRPRTFQAATTPLVEGVTPTPEPFRYEDVQAQIRQYGHLVEVTDVIEDTHEDPVLNDATKQSGENLGRTTEALTWGVLRAGTNVFYANGTSRTDVNTPISLSKQRAVTRALKKQKGQLITEVMDGSPNWSTRPVEAAYVAVGHTDLDNDIRNLPGFKPVAEYGTIRTVSPHEIGSAENVRYVLSPDLDPILDAGGAFGGSGTNMVTTSGTSADIYPILFFAEEAYGVVPLRGQGSIEPTVLRPGVKSKSDPLGQRGYIGWKMWFTAVILNQLWMARLEVASTAL
jgi:N4-gp56 family major capsid protein